MDTPAFTGEEVPEELRHLLVGPTWVEERRRRWGESSPIYVSKVLGRFPSVSEDTLISPELITAAQHRDLPERGPVRYGVDPARNGPDETCVYRVQGGRVRLARRAGQQDTMATTGMVAAALREEDDRGPTYTAVIDAVGIGAGVYDRLREQGLSVLAFNGGNSPHDRQRFGNRRAEVFWRLRESFERGDIDLDPDDEDLAAQLAGLRFRLDSRGRTFIESKDEMRKRGMPSPDRADALSMAWEPPSGWASPHGYTGGCDRCGTVLGSKRRYWFEVENDDGRWAVCVDCLRGASDQILRLHEPAPDSVPSWEELSRRWSEHRATGELRWWCPASRSSAHQLVEIPAA